tara:strand:+ start:122 stop:2710 length:2589 start_codon:yes stop_codon:yes gene_type:complete
MPLQVLQYKPGIVKDITEYSAGKNGPFWVDGSLVRFRNGYPMKVGGWQKDEIFRTDSAGTITSTATTIQGIARKMVFWRANTDGEDRIAVGTHTHLYIIQDQVLYDITPLRDVSNTATTTGEAVDSSETEIDLASVTGFTTAGTIKIDSEIITYTGITSSTLTGCTRGTNSTSAASHDNGATVTQILIGPIATTDGSTTITITDTAHGAKVGDYVRLTGATGTGGVDGDGNPTFTTEILNRPEGFEITAITTNTFTVTAPLAATATVSAGGGNDVVINYLIGIDAGLGVQTSAPALGWGIGGWGEGTWNTPRSASSSDVSLDNSSWSLSLWGEDLIATVRGGAIYYWSVSGTVSNRAVLVSSLSGAESVPNVARVTTVSFPDRHFIAGGCQEFGGGGNFDPMLVRFSTQEDFTKFKPTATNTAGDQRLEIGTKIVAMVSSREETIISTDEAIYGMTFVGPPFTFSFRLLATNAGASGLNSMINIDGDVYWMGKRNFFRYDGVVKELPCPVKHYVFNRMQDKYIDKVVVGHNKRFKEITWFYPSNDVEYSVTISSISTTDSQFGTRRPEAFYVGDEIEVGDADGYLFFFNTGRTRITKVTGGIDTQGGIGSTITFVIDTSDPEFGGSGSGVTSISAYTEKYFFSKKPPTWTRIQRKDFQGGILKNTTTGTISSISFGVNASIDGYADNPENDSYVTYNYAENIWTIGSLARTVWSDSFGARGNPFAFDSGGELYNHEIGTSDDNNDMTAFIEGSPQEISTSGENTYLVDKIIPDIHVGQGTNLELFVNTKQYPTVTTDSSSSNFFASANQGITKGPFDITTTTEKISMRARGRQMSMKLQSTGSTDEWVMGTFRINAREDGMR